MKQGSAYLATEKAANTSPGIEIILDRICAVLLALCPILQHYEGPVYNAALTVLVVMVPYLLIRMLKKVLRLNLTGLSLGAATIVYFVYRVIDHGTSVTEIGQSGVFVIFMAAMVMGCIDVGFMVKTAAGISAMASLCLLVQYICFYLFGFHLQLVPTSLLLPMAEQWKLGAQTGLVAITGRVSSFYRPSAFFLEPSHIFQYMFPYLVLALFCEGLDKKRLALDAVFTMGLVLSTSGMGIAAAAGIWGLFLILQGKDGTFSIKNVVRPRNLALEAALLVVLALAVAFVPTIRRTVTRIFTSGTGISAISGRVSKAFALLSELTARQWVFGVMDTTHSITFNMPGFVAALYRHGLIGLVLSYEFYVKSLFRLKLPFVIVGGLVIVVSFFSAHTHSTVGMLYYFLILTCGYRMLEKRSNWENQCRKTNSEEAHPWR